MGRPPRDFVPNAIYHVFSRGSNRQAIFTFDSDRIDFLECFSRIVRTYEVTCLAYCLMPNHYHLMLSTTDGRLSPAMKALNGRYSLRFNQRYGRNAHLFKNRFGATRQQDETQFVWTLRYILWNPVEAELCASPEEWPWSSYSASMGVTRPSACLHLGRLLGYFGDDIDTARSRFLELVGPLHELTVSDTGSRRGHLRPAI